MDEDEYIKKNNIVEKNYDVMDIYELNDELIKARKTLLPILYVYSIESKIVFSVKITAPYLKNHLIITNHIN